MNPAGTSSVANFDRPHFARKFRAGVLGATGLVGQRLVQLLDGHPWFELTEVAASERSSGKKYWEAAAWRLDVPMPAAASNLLVKPLDPTLDCDFVFSALDSSVAGPAEEEFARAGYPVVSNSKNHRMSPDVPLLIPEVNAAHLTPSRTSRRIVVMAPALLSPIPIAPRRDWFLLSSLSLTHSAWKKYLSSP